MLLTLELELLPSKPSNTLCMEMRQFNYKALVKYFIYSVVGTDYIWK